MGCREGKLSKDDSICGDTELKITPVLTLHASQAKGDCSRNHQRGKRTKSKKARRCQNNRRSSNECSNNRRKRRRETIGKTKLNCDDPRITAKYDVKGVIGKGSYSRVVRVENRVTKQPYAIKMIESIEGREVFEAELSVLRRINHTNVIRLVEVFESNRKVYMVMELSTGGSLLDRLETRGNFGESEAGRVLKMVISGVGYLHKLGITHRDLRPDNLLYYHPGSDSRILITDFGFASTRKASGNPYMHTVCGVPHYIAPEVVARRPYTCLIDMWAVGVITYILLCGTFPFDAEQDSQIFKLILKGSYIMNGPVWEDISEEGKVFVRSLLEREPNNRLTASQALDHVWICEVSQQQTGGRTMNVCRRPGSMKSSRSLASVRSGRSVHSLRSGHRRVRAQQLDVLCSDPEVAGMIR